LSFLESLIDDAKGMACRFIETEDKFFRSFELLPGASVIQPPAAALRDQGSRLFCNREPPPLPPYPPPDNNCEGGYSIRVKFFEKADDGRSRTGENEIGVWGPVLSFRYGNYTTEDVPQLFEVLAFGGTNQDRLATPVYSQLATGVYGNPAAERFIVDIIFVQPGGGNPNNCGTPIPNPPDYDPYTDKQNRNITYINEEGDSVNINAEATIGFAFNTQNNSIAFPVTYSFSPSYSFAPGFKYNVDVVFNYDGSPPTVTPPYVNPPPPGQPGAPGPNGQNPNPYLPPKQPSPPTLNPPPDSAPPPPPPDVPDPPAPPKKTDPVIVGALVTAAGVEGSANISTLGQQENPDVWFPDLGLVSFLIRTEFGSFGWTEDIRVKNKRQFIPCPWSRGAVKVQGTPRLGVTWTVTPVYGTPSD